MKSEYCQFIMNVMLEPMLTLYIKAILSPRGYK